VTFLLCYTILYALVSIAYIEEGIVLVEGRIIVFYRFDALKIVALNQGTPRPIVEMVESKVEL
jgi:hypothetical protein